MPEVNGGSARPMEIGRRDSVFELSHSSEPPGTVDPEEALVAVLRDLLQQPEFASDDLDAEQVAMEMTQCINGPELDLWTVSESVAKCLQDPAPWPLLDQIAKARNMGNSIHSAQIGNQFSLASPEDPSTMNPVVAGLKALTGLKTLLVPMQLVDPGTSPKPYSPETAVDLRHLQGQPDQGEHSGLENLFQMGYGDDLSAGEEYQPQLITVGRNVKVEARNAGLALQKNLVQYAEADGRVDETEKRRPLYGQPHLRTAREFMGWQAPESPDLADDQPPDVFGDSHEAPSAAISELVRELAELNALDEGHDALPSWQQDSAPEENADAEYEPPSQAEAEPTDPSWDAQMNASQLMLNQVTSMQVVDAVSGEVTLSLIECRHLTARWLDDRLKRLVESGAQQWTAPDPVAPMPAAEAPGLMRKQAEPFSYSEYMTEASLQEHVGFAQELQQRQMLMAGASEMFGMQTFGGSMADAFSGMRPGQFRLFAVGTDVHMMGLEMSVKELPHGDRTRVEYVVNIYDPNITANHPRQVVLDPDSLTELGLGAWVRQSNAKSYSPSGLGMLYCWPPGPEQSGGATKMKVDRMPPELRSDPRVMLNLGLTEGDVGLVEESVNQLVRAHSADPAELENKLLAASGAGRRHDMPGMHCAVARCERSAALSKYVTAILNVPTLDPQAKCRLLTARSGHVQTSHSDWLRFMLSSGKQSATLAVVQAVLEAPDSALTREGRQALLMARSEEGQPMLNALCAQPTAPLDELQVKRLEALHAFIREVVSSKALSEDEKLSIVTSQWGPGGEESIPAARLALANKNPGAAAAILLGILRADASPELQQHLLSALGVTAAEVVDQLRQPSRFPTDERWMQEVAQFIEQRIPAP